MRSLTESLEIDPDDFDESADCEAKGNEADDDGSEEERRGRGM